MASETDVPVPILITELKSVESGFNQPKDTGSIVEGKENIGIEGNAATSEGESFSESPSVAKTACRAAEEFQADEKPNQTTLLMSETENQLLNQKKIEVVEGTGEESEVLKVDSRTQVPDKEENKDSIFSTEIPQIQDELAETSSGREESKETDNPFLVDKRSHEAIKASENTKNEEQEGEDIHYGSNRDTPISTVTEGPDIQKNEVVITETPEVGTCSKNADTLKDEDKLAENITAQDKVKSSENLENEILLEDEIKEKNLDTPLVRETQRDYMGLPTRDDADKFKEFSGAGADGTVKEDSEGSNLENEVLEKTTQHDSVVDEMGNPAKDLEQKLDDPFVKPEKCLQGGDSELTSIATLNEEKKEEERFDIVVANKNLSDTQPIETEKPRKQENPKHEEGAMDNIEESFEGKNKSGFLKEPEKPAVHEAIASETNQNDEIKETISTEASMDKNGENESHNRVSEHKENKVVLVKVEKNNEEQIPRDKEGQKEILEKETPPEKPEQKSNVVPEETESVNLIECAKKEGSIENLEEALDLSKNLLADEKEAEESKNKTVGKSEKAVVGESIACEALKNDESPEKISIKNEPHGTVKEENDKYAGIAKVGDSKEILQRDELGENLEHMPNVMPEKCEPAHSSGESERSTYTEEEGSIQNPEEALDLVKNIQAQEEEAAISKAEVYGSLKSDGISEETEQFSMIEEQIISNNLPEIAGNQTHQSSQNDGKKQENPNVEMSPEPETISVVGNRTLEENNTVNKGIIDDSQEDEVTEKIPKEEGLHENPIFSGNNDPTEDCSKTKDSAIINSLPQTTGHGTYQGSLKDEEETQCTEMCKEPETHTSSGQISQEEKAIQEEIVADSFRENEATEKVPNEEARETDRGADKYEDITKQIEEEDGTSEDCKRNVGEEPGEDSPDESKEDKEPNIEPKVSLNMGEQILISVHDDKKLEGVSELMVKDEDIEELTEPNKTRTEVEINKVEDLNPESPQEQSIGHMVQGDAGEAIELKQQAEDQIDTTQDTNDESKDIVTEEVPEEVEKASESENIKEQIMLEEQSDAKELHMLTRSEETISKVEDSSTETAENLEPINSDENPGTKASELAEDQNTGPKISLTARELEEIQTLNEGSDKSANISEMSEEPETISMVGKPSLEQDNTINTKRISKQEMCEQPEKDTTGVHVLQEEKAVQEDIVDGSFRESEATKKVAEEEGTEKDSKTSVGEAVVEKDTPDENKVDKESNKEADLTLKDEDVKALTESNKTGTDAQINKDKDLNLKSLGEQSIQHVVKGGESDKEETQDPKQQAEDHIDTSKNTNEEIKDILTEEVPEEVEKASESENIKEQSILEEQSDAKELHMVSSNDETISNIEDSSAETAENHKAINSIENPWTEASELAEDQHTVRKISLTAQEPEESQTLNEGSDKSANISEKKPTPLAQMSENPETISMVEKQSLDEDNTINTEKIPRQEMCEEPENDTTGVHILQEEKAMQEDIVDGSFRESEVTKKVAEEEGTGKDSKTSVGEKAVKEDTPDENKADKESSKEADLTVKDEDVEAIIGTNKTGTDAQISKDNDLNLKSLEEQSIEHLVQGGESNKDQTQDHKQQAEDQIDTAKNTNNNIKYILTEEVPEEVEKATESENIKEQIISEEKSDANEPHIVTSSDETISKVKNTDLVPVESHRAKGSNISITASEVSEEVITEKIIKEARNFNDKLGTGSVTEITEEARFQESEPKEKPTEEEEKTQKNIEIVESSPKLEEFDSIKVKETSDLKTQFPTTKCVNVGEERVTMEKIDADEAEEAKRISDAAFESGKQLVINFDENELAMEMENSKAKKYKERKESPETLSEFTYKGVDPISENRSTTVSTDHDIPAEESQEQLQEPVSTWLPKEQKHETVKSIDDAEGDIRKEDKTVEIENQSDSKSREIIEAFSLKEESLTETSNLVEEIQYNPEGQKETDDGVLQSEQHDASREKFTESPSESDNINGLSLPTTQKAVEEISPNEVGERHKEVPNLTFDKVMQDSNWTSEVESPELLAKLEETKVEEEPPTKALADVRVEENQLTEAIVANEIIENQSTNEESVEEKAVAKESQSVSIDEAPSTERHKEDELAAEEYPGKETSEVTQSEVTQKANKGIQIKEVKNDQCTTEMNDEEAVKTNDEEESNRNPETPTTAEIAAEEALHGKVVEKIEESSKIIPEIPIGQVMTTHEGNKEIDVATTENLKAITENVSPEAASDGISATEALESKIQDIYCKQPGNSPLTGTSQKEITDKNGNTAVTEIEGQHDWVPAKKMTDTGTPEELKSTVEKPDETGQISMEENYKSHDDAKVQTTVCADERGETRDEKEKPGILLQNQKSGKKILQERGTEDPIEANEFAKANQLDIPTLAISEQQITREADPTGSKETMISFGNADVPQISERDEVEDLKATNAPGTEPEAEVEENGREKTIGAPNEESSEDLAKVSLQTTEQVTQERNTTASKEEIQTENAKAVPLEGDKPEKGVEHGKVEHDQCSTEMYDKETCNLNGKEEANSNTDTQQTIKVAAEEALHGTDATKSLGFLREDEEHKHVCLDSVSGGIDATEDLEPKIQDVYSKQPGNSSLTENSRKEIPDESGNIAVKEDERQHNWVPDWEKNDSSTPVESKGTQEKDAENGLKENYNSHDEGRIHNTTCANESGESQDEKENKGILLQTQDSGIRILQERGTASLVETKFAKDKQLDKTTHAISEQKISRDSNESKEKITTFGDADVPQISHRDEVEDQKPRNASGTESEAEGEECGGEKGIGDENEESTGIPSEDLAKASLQTTEQMAQERNTTTSKEEMQTEDAKAISLEEENPAKQEVEHEKVDSGCDAPGKAEAPRDTDVKVVHKRSHNILSGVGSKVKHSISKVKKAIVGKSSHKG